MDRSLSLAVVRFEHEGALLGVLPLAERTLRRGGMTYREAVGLCDVVAPESAFSLGDNGPLLLPGCEQAVTACLRQAIATRSLGDWDALTLTRMRSSSPTASLLRAGLRSLGSCPLHVSGSEHYGRLPDDAPVTAPVDDLHVAPLREAGDEPLSTLIRRAGVADLRDACRALDRDGVVELVWRGERATAEAIAALIVGPEHIAVLASWGTDITEGALHAARMRQAVAAGEGVRDYEVWHAKSGPHRIGGRERPLVTLALEPRTPASRVRLMADALQGMVRAVLER